MKRNENFLLHQVAGTQVLVPVGPAAEAFSGMLTVNETGAFIWQQLETAHTLEALAQAIASEYAVEEDTARQDAQAFIEKLLPTGAIIEE